jgi:tetratricopeptide (TPR) repeat protein
MKDGFEPQIEVTPSAEGMESGRKDAIEEPAGPKYSVDDIVTTAYGEGKISSIREEDGMYVVHLVNWKLATGSNPVLYMKESAILSTDKKNLTDSFTTCLDKANEAKAKAGSFFKEGQIKDAKEMYIVCLRAIESLSSDNLSNKQRAKVFDLTVTSSNNAALCFLRLKKYQECTFYARSALNLITALEPRMETGKVWQCLLKEGMTKDKLFKEWKKKSLFYIGKSELMRKNYQTAIDRMREALEIIDTDNQDNVHPSIANNIIELKELIVQAEKKKNDEIKREKSTWQKAFKKDKLEAQAESSGAASSDGVSSTLPSTTTSSFSTAAIATSPSVRFTKGDNDIAKTEDLLPEELINPTGSGDGFPYVRTMLVVGFLGSLGTAAYWYMRVKSKEK